MSGRSHSRNHLRLVVDNGRPYGSDDEDAALEAFCQAQARCLETRSKEDREAARKAYRAFVIASGGDPDKAEPLHGWRY